MADQTRTMVLDAHEVVIRINRAPDGTPDVSLEFPACRCDAAPPKDLIDAITRSVALTLIEWRQETTNYSVADLQPTQAPASA